MHNSLTDDVLRCCRSANGQRLRRRTFIMLVGGAALAWPIAAHPQPVTTKKIGFLCLGNPDPEPFLKALRTGLRDLGYVEGRDIQFEIRSAKGSASRLTTLAAELVALKVNVLVAFQTPAASAAKEATKEIPIVMYVADPVRQGFVSSLSRPGGNLTGVDPAGETLEKNLEIIHELLPSIRRVAALSNANDPFSEPFLEHMRSAANRLNIEIKTVMVRSADELDTDFTDIAKWRAEALIVQPSISQKRIAELALRYRLAAAGLQSFVQLGGLISYGADAQALYGRAAVFVDKILRGAKPGDLPVEMPTKFWLAVNLKTAKALGIRVPQEIMARADEVIN